MTDVTPGTDGAISFGRMEQVYNAVLANSWGNLFSRSTNLCIKYFEGATPERDASAAGYAENPLAAAAEGIFDRYAAKMEAFAYGDVCIKYFEGATPERDASAAGYAENPLAAAAEGIFDRYAAKMEAFAYGDAAKEVMDLIHAANHYIEDSEPWTLAKDPAKASSVSRATVTTS